MSLSPTVLQRYSFYRDQLLSVRRNYHPRTGWAPNKPVFLLALLQYLERFEPVNNQVHLIELFAIFEDQWALLTDKKWKNKNFLYPAYYLQSDGFWSLVDKRGIEAKDVINQTQLRAGIFTGRLNSELFKMLSNPTIRQVLRLELLDAFFPGKEQEYLSAFPTPYKAILWELEAEVLGERPAKKGQVKIEYEGFIRAASFRRTILKVYDKRCALSGFGVYGTVPIIDAAHIQPFVQSGNNSVRNGIAMAPTLHRAFDRGLISISDDYKVLIHPSVREHDSPFALSIIEGRALHLPVRTDFHPGIQHLREHRKRWKF